MNRILYQKGEIMSRRWSFLLAVLLFPACRPDFRSPDDLIEAHLQAIGGYENLKAIHTLTSIVLYEESGDAGIHRIDRKRPNLLRISTGYDEKTETFGYCEGFDGAAWEYGFKIPVRVVGEPARALRNASRFEKPYVDYKQKDYRAKLLGKTMIHGNEVYHLQLSRSDGKIENFFFDVNTLMESISVGNAPLHGEGAAIEIFEKRSEYKPVNGVLMPFRVEQKSGDSTLSSFTVKKLIANNDVPDDWFSPPLSEEEQMFKAFREDILMGDMKELGSRYEEYYKLSTRIHLKKIENQMNAFGYELISHNRRRDAIEVFKLALKHASNSGNLHDSIGETYLSLGDTVRAIAHYQKSIDLDPTNEHGRRVLDQLKGS